MSSPNGAIRIAPAVVYVGPTIPREMVAELLPGADIRPPMRRGDLHFFRQLHYSLFIIIDGVFYHDEAVPPREVIDILEDGAVVLGAASLGALRAAELWPLGMAGTGAIYRLYRRGVLVDEDEVAVLFNPESPHPPLTEALVDIRWSLHQARRDGRLTAHEAQTLLDEARRSPFPERTWERLSCAAPFRSLKERDAVMLLHRVSRWVSRDPSVLRRPRRTRQPFPDHQALREGNSDPWAGIDLDKDGKGLRRWLAGLGHPLESAGPEIDLKAPPSQFMRYRAFRDAIATARARRVQPQERHRLAAEASIARAHGVPDWATLCLNPPISHQDLETLCSDLCLTKALRDELFESAGQNP